MTKEDIIQKVKSLKLPSDSYVVFGSGPLVVAGIREASDIDIYVTPEIIEMKKAEGWKFLDKGGKDIPLVNDVFEMHTNWNFGTAYNPTFKEMKATATMHDGVLFASIHEVRKWKLASVRSKDLADIKLIDEFLQRS
ncbi:MAG TPA: hypothetical protein VJK09_00490 [Candidatus Paceibacterota bacterium]